MCTENCNVQSIEARRLLSFIKNEESDKYLSRRVILFSDLIIILREQTFNLYKLEYHKQFHDSKSPVYSCISRHAYIKAVT